MTTSCYVCHRPLKDPKSIERGMGDICASHNQKDSMLANLAKQGEYTDEFDGTVPFTQAFVMKRRGPKTEADLDRTVVTNISHLVAHHSPEGYEFGYAGSGPADLALNVCQLYLNITDYQGRKTKCWDGQCWTLAWMLHQDFKNAFVANAPKSGTSIPFGEIDTWMKDHITVNLLQQCAEETESEE